MLIVRGLAVFAGAYLVGSVPSAVLITRWVSGLDVREVGSGHAGATNTLRAAGWLPGVVVALLDLAKGFLAVEVGLRWGASLGVVAAAAVVVGHCWPLFAQFRGGIGVATSGGALLAAGPMGFVLGVGLDALLTLLLRHAARANFFSGLLLGPLLWAVGMEGSLVAVAAAVGVVVAGRSLSDWNRSYQELWLDRPQAE